MKIETYVIEERHFGDAQGAYEYHSQIEKLFQEKREIYRETFNAVSSKKIHDIIVDEMRKLDKMAKQVLMVQKKYQENKHVLLKHIDRLVQTIKQQERDYNTYIKQNNDLPAARHAKKLFEESLILRDHNNLRKSLEKAHLAHECFQALTADIKNKWIHKHQSRLGGMFKDMDVIE
ncbi:MAG: hypothetical protein HQK75_17030 [Candidatus Magnetomorum sp.]|nr:hypothetical protein [Candidatus Magnetomorum sp.]